MVLRGINKGEEGSYTCETSNKGGSANDSIKVIVDSKTLKFCWYSWNLARKEHLIDDTVEYTFLIENAWNQEKHWTPTTWHVVNLLQAKSNKLFTDSKHRWWELSTLLGLITLSEDWNIRLKINDGSQWNQNILTKDQECSFGSQTKTNTVTVENAVTVISAHKQHTTLRLINHSITKSYRPNISIISNQFRKIELWLTPSKQPSDITISRNTQDFYTWRVIQKFENSQKLKKNSFI